jgi:hypothetical protein
MLAQAIVKTALKYKTELVFISGKPTLVSQMPILQNDLNIAKPLSQDYMMTLAVLLDTISSQIWSNDDIRPLLIDPAVAALFNDPRFVRAQVAAIRPPVDANNDSAEQMFDVVSALIEFRQKIEIIENKNIESARNVQKSSDELLVAADQIKIEVADEFKAFKVEKTAEIEAAREVFEEGLRLRSAFDLWRSKARWHGIRFWIGLALFVGGVVAAISSVLRYGKEFLAILPMKNEEPTYLAILIVVLCAGGYGWVLRFFARYASDNLALGADAAQRRTMVHTYLALAADKNIKVEPSDRSMMLAAAFRPLPGQAVEDINVPTIVEVVQKAVGGGKTG